MDLQTARTKYVASDLPTNLGVSIGEHVAAGSPLQDYVTKFNSLDATSSTYPLSAALACAQVNVFDKEYEKIIAPLVGNNVNLPSTIITQRNTELLLDISGLQTKLEDLKTNQSVSQLRNDTLRSGNGAVSNHQIYLLGRPLRPASIPYLWGLSVLFIGIGVLVFYMFYPYTSPPFEIFVFDLYMLFSSPYTWGILFGISSVVILFLTLYTLGYI